MIELLFTVIFTAFGYYRYFNANLFHNNYYYDHDQHQRFNLWGWLWKQAFNIAFLCLFTLLLRWPLTTTYLGIITSILCWNQVISMRDVYALDGYSVTVFCVAWFVSAHCATATVDSIKWIKEAIMNAIIQFAYALSQIPINIAKKFMNLLARAGRSVARLIFGRHLRVEDDCYEDYDNFDDDHTYYSDDETYVEDDDEDYVYQREPDDDTLIYDVEEDFAFRDDSNPLISAVSVRRSVRLLARHFSQQPYY